MLLFLTACTPGATILQIQSEITCLIKSDYLHDWVSGMSAPDISDPRRISENPTRDDQATDQFHSTTGPSTLPEKATPSGNRPLPQIPGYTVVRLIDVGGMGEVYEAINQLDNRVALKLIRPDRADAEFLARFRQEAATLQRLNHPNIVRIYEYGVHNGVPYFTMQLLSGGTLLSRMSEYRGEAKKVVGLLATVAEAVGYIHNCTKLHRDLKPGNVLFDEASSPHISDFGLVKEHLSAEPVVAGENALTSSSSASGYGPGSPPLTMSGCVIGTLQYMSPEQARGDGNRIGPWSDVWALGVMLYELLTSTRPFASRDIDVLQRLIQSEDPPSPRQLNPQLDERLEAIVLKCLARQPEARYSTATALAADLRQWLQQAAASHEGTPSFSRGWKRRIVIGLSTGLALALVAVGLALKGTRLPESPLQEAQRALVRGESVNVIGATGMPIYHRIQAGRDTSCRISDDGCFTIGSEELALVEILPDPMCEHYAFRVWVQQKTWMTRASRAGIYCLHSAHENDRGRQHYFLELSVMEDDEEEKVLRGIPITDRTRRVASLDCLLRGASPSPRFNDNIPLWREAIPTVLTPGREEEPWRELIVKVSPQGVSAHHGKKKLGELSRTALDRKAGLLAAMQSQLSNTAAFAERGGLGFCVLGGSASFRLGVLEPLSDPE